MTSRRPAWSFRALYDGDVPVIVFPDGRRRRGDAPDVHAALSAAVAQPVTLARETAISHRDAGPLHLLTTVSLAWLAALVPDAAVDDRRDPRILLHIVDAADLQFGVDAEVVVSGRIRCREAVTVVDE